MKYTVKISHLSFELELIPKVEEVPIMVNPEPNIPVVEVPETVIVQEPVIVPVTPVISVGMEVIDISESFLGKDQIKLESGKHYKAGLIKSQMLLNRDVKIYSESEDNRPILEFGVKEYRPLKHGKQDGNLFMMHDNSSLFIDNVDICQEKQIQTVETFNPRLLISAQWPSAKWDAVIRNCDTTRLGNNGGFGAGLIYGGTQENHLALINFKHFGTGLMDAKNPYQDAVMYVTMRKVDTYALEDAKLNKTSFEHKASLSNGVLTFDGSVFSLTSGYNWTWMDNDSYIVLFDRFTFFLDGYNADTVVSDYQFRIRPQAKGKCTFGVLSNSQIYSDSLEMHAGDKFRFGGETYMVTSKYRIEYPLFDDRTTEAKKDPLKSRSIVYKLDKSLNTNESIIEIEYLSPKIEFTDQNITLLYKANGGFGTTIKTKYRESSMMNSRGIGHLSYNHSDISMDAQNVNHLGFYRGSEKGKGKSLIWNLDKCKGFEDSGAYFMTAIPVTHEKDLPIHKRALRIIS